MENIDVKKTQTTLENLTKGMETLQEQKTKLQEKLSELNKVIDDLEFEIDVWKQIYKISKEQDKCD